MRVAVSAEEAGGIESKVSQHFGRSPFFVFVDMDDSGVPTTVRAAANPFYENHTCADVVTFIKQNDADVMLSGGMGMGAVGHFQVVGIDVYTGASGTVQDAIKAFQALQLANNVACCHGHDDCHGHG